MADDPLSRVDWEPKARERTWYRHAVTADKGFLCRVKGRTMIRYDRPNDPTAIVPYESGEWNIDREHRPMSALQTTLVAYAADQQLCRVLGLHRKVKDFISLSDKARIAWIHRGPEKPAIRGELYQAVRETLRKLEG